MAFCPRRMVYPCFFGKTVSATSATVSMSRPGKVATIRFWVRFSRRTWAPPFLEAPYGRVLQSARYTLRWMPRSRSTLAQVREAPPLPRYRTTAPSSRCGALKRAYSSHTKYGTGFSTSWAPSRAAPMSEVANATLPKIPVGRDWMSSTSMPPLARTSVSLSSSRENKATS